MQERVEAVTDDADIDEVYNTERNLLYVACTRARNRLLVTSADPASRVSGRPARVKDAVDVLRPPSRYS